MLAACDQRLKENLKTFVAVSFGETPVKKYEEKLFFLQYRGQESLFSTCMKHYPLKKLTRKCPA